MNRYLVCILLFCFFSCSKNSDALQSEKLFSIVTSEESGIEFENRILESEQLHYYKYQYIYMGGGVAAADFNNDGLQDLFFTSNIYPNKLYINKGDFTFEDITEQAGIIKRPGFDAGVSVADVNNDGYLDIYINRAGWYSGDEKLANMLYINNGDLTFTEQAETFGIADKNRSISSTFFDYDKDGDLDLFISNAPTDFSLTGALLDLDQIPNQVEKISKLKSSDKLYRNNGNGFFEDVSEDAGILLDVGFGLHAQVCDLNNDGWPDIYVSNDFIMPDFAYINNKDGTFTDRKEELFKHISYYSMGGDFADINNDGLSDLMVADMSPEDYVRSKTTMSMMSIDRFNTMTANGYQYQYMHNVLQLNNGNNTSFSEISHLSGVSKTDWSWATLFADFDLDGYNDLYVTNGVYRDVVDRDANNEINEYINKNKSELQKEDFYKFTQKLPQHKLKNYLFKNEGNLKFTDATQEWSNIPPTFSNGAVYVDLDNDGDLDIVTNNLDETPTLLRNNATEITKNKFLQIEFKGPELNKFGEGAKVNIYKNNGEILTRDFIRSRGYLSSMSSILHFGLGKENQNITKIEITWSDGNTQTLEDVVPNQKIIVNYEQSHKPSEIIKKPTQDLFIEKPFDVSHQEIAYNDYDKQLLLPHKLSQTGPASAKADVNNDGLEDLFIGGAHQQEAKLLMANKDGTFDAIDVPAFSEDKQYEDVSAVFFDADNDGDLDLYVVSGSYEFSENSELLQDRLYINDGRNNFKRSDSLIPSIRSAGSVVVASDFDGDGDTDLFVGSRVIPGKYPYAPSNYLLINDNGNFTNQISTIAPEAEHLGMITDAHWADMDNDNNLDLILTGEWMGIEVFLNKNNKLVQDKAYKDLSDAKGWWNKIWIEDVNNDGKKDIIAGNLGLNYKFKASKEKPFHIYTNDFDDNGVEDIILAKHYKSKQVPVRGKSCTSQQMPYLKDKIKTYDEFANSDLKGILGEGIESSLHYQATEFASGLFLNDADGKFTFHPFSLKAQIAPINSIVYKDFDSDGIKDLVLAGNNYHSEVETTRADAGIGSFLKGVGKGNFTPVSNSEIGFYANSDVRSIECFENDNTYQLIIINNNDKHKMYEISKK